MHRQFQFTMKQFHNLLLTTLIQNPLIILCTHKPAPAQYDRDQYLPYEEWDHCLALYREYLTTNHILFTEYDYTMHHNIEHYITLDRRFKSGTSWWVPMWQQGYGCIGSSHPDFLLVAERIGPNNSHCIPFETGPTGFMLTDMLTQTGTPLGKFAVTNMVKVPRQVDRRSAEYSRAVSDRDKELLAIEIRNLLPKKVIFMGAVAKAGIPIARDLGCETADIVHLGSLNYKGVTDLTGYCTEWRKLIGLVPTRTFK